MRFGRSSRLADFRQSAPTISPRPKKTLRTDFAVWIVDSLLVRATDNAVHHPHRTHPLLSKESCYLCHHLLVCPDVAGIDEPPSYDSVRIGRLNYARSYLGGAAIVGA